MNRGHRGIGSALRSADRYRQRIADQIYQQQEETRSAYPRFSSVDPLLMRDLYFESLEVDFRRKYGADFAPYLAEAKLSYDRSNGYTTDTSDDDCDRNLDGDSCASDAADLEIAPTIPSEEMEQQVVDFEVQHTVITVEPPSDSEPESDDHEVLVFQDEPVAEASAPLVRPVAVVAPNPIDVAARPSIIDNSSLSFQIKHGLLSIYGAAQSWFSSLTEMIFQHYDRFDALSNLAFDNNNSYRLFLAGVVILFSLPDYVYAKSGVLSKVLYALYAILAILYLICTDPSADPAAGKEQAHALAPKPEYFDTHVFE